MLGVACASLYASGARAETAEPDSADGAVRHKVCIDIEVNGIRTPSYDCLSRKLQAATVPAAGASAPMSAQLATQASNRVGTFNLSAERNRFGANWGKSAIPQRPAAPVAVPPR
ncbi:hypothetical protein G3N92_31795 [Burkholderia sp. Ac-20379]|nr:hypothetical protein [Burkholderia sp. Ac-20379]